MKKHILLFTGLVLAAISYSQREPLVLDNEKMFTRAETKRLDSMLQAYRAKTKNIVLIYTDTADLSLRKYPDSLAIKYSPDSLAKPYIFMLLLSREKDLVLASVNDKVLTVIPRPELFKILDAGIPSIQKGRKEEAARLICEKGMLFLDELKKE
jgi:hypothetical protein